MSYGPIVGGLLSGIAGSIFGQPKTNPYADQLKAQADALANEAAGYGELASGNEADYREFNPLYKEAVTSDANYLSTNPYTDQYGTQVLGNATAGVNNDYARATADVARDMAHRGLSGGGLQVGTDDSIAAARAGEIAGAQNNLARDEVTNAGQRAAELTSLYGNVATGYRNAGLQDRSGEMAANNDVSNIYSGLNNAANGVAEQQSQQQGAAISGFGNAVGAYIGRGATPDTTPHSDPSLDPYTIQPNDNLPSLTTDMNGYDPLAGQPTRAQRVNPAAAYLLSKNMGNY